MKITKLFVLPAVVTLALVGGPSEPSGLTVTCPDNTAGPTCPAGQVTFTGTGYNNHTNVVVTGSNGTVIDDGFYQAPGGLLSFTEGLSFPDTYTIQLLRKGGHDVVETLVVTTY
jgi:hypothetical protein